jgi:phospholipase/carboxylesterase
MRQGQWIARRDEAAGLRYIEVAAEGVPDGAPLVIGLHGRGSSADDLAGIAPALDPAWRYVFPQAPLRLDFGGWGAGFSWYEPIPASQERMATARAALADFLVATHERLQIPPGRSALAGFSQGATMTLDTGLRADPSYAALVAMSGYLAESDELPAVIAAARAQPVLIVHGVADNVLGITLARRARQTLEANGLSPDYHEFPMAHEVSGDSLEAVRAFLARHLNSAPSGE